MEVSKVIFVSRPGPNNPPSEANFGIKTGIIDLDNGNEGAILVKSLLLSVDPALRFVNLDSILDKFGLNLDKSG